MAQTLNTATAATGLNICDNVTTGDVGFCTSQTSGAIDIGTFSTRSAQITIGGDASTSPVRIESGVGGVNVIANNAGPVSMSAAGALTLTGSTTVDIVSPTEGQINMGNTLTTGQIYVGDTAARTGDIQIGNLAATGEIFVESAGGVFLGHTNQHIDVDHTGGNIEVVSAGNFNLTAAKLRVLDTSNATSSSNGSVNFKGGIGIEQNVYGDSNCIMGGDWRSIDPTRSLLMFNGNTTGSVTIGGGMTTANINLGVSTQTGQVKILSTAASTSGTTGALTCAGGVGFEKLINLDGGLNFSTKPLYTQTTSNSTTVVANTRIGIITTFGGSINAHSTANFTVTNSEVGTGSFITLHVLGHTGAGMPYPTVFSRASGSFILKLSNTENTTMTGSVVIGFSVQ